MINYINDKIGMHLLNLVGHSMVGNLLHCNDLCVSTSEVKCETDGTYELFL